MQALRQGAKLVLFLTGLSSLLLLLPLLRQRASHLLLQGAAGGGRVHGRPGDGDHGGGPSLRFRRLLRYLRVLKEELGPGHHVHLYCTELSRERLRRLKEEGLDEIRSHVWSPKPVRRAVKVG